MGTVKKIVYKPGDGPPKLPEMVYVKFPSYLGDSAFPDEEKVVPITPMTHDWIYAGKPCSRTQICLRNANAITIHKSQGKFQFLHPLPDAFSNFFFISRYDS